MFDCLTSQATLTPRDIVMETQDEATDNSKLRDHSVDGSLNEQGRERVKEWVVSTEVDQEGSGERRMTRT